MSKFESSTWFIQEHASENDKKSISSSRKWKTQRNSAGLKKNISSSQNELISIIRKNVFRAHAIQMRALHQPQMYMYKLHHTSESTKSKRRVQEQEKRREIGKNRGTSITVICNRQQMQNYLRRRFREADSRCCSACRYIEARLRAPTRYVSHARVPNAL